MVAGSKKGEGAAASRQAPIAELTSQLYVTFGQAAALAAGAAARTSDRRIDLRKQAVDGSAEHGDRGNAGDNDQGQHDRVLGCSWAIFRLQKSLQRVHTCDSPFYGGLRRTAQVEFEGRASTESWLAPPP